MCIRDSQRSDHHMRIRRSLAGVTAAALLGALAVPLSAMAVDIQVPAKVYLVKQDANAGYVGKLKVIKAICKGPNSTDSPAPFTIPINQTLGAAWELVIGPDRYCAESS